MILGKDSEQISASNKIRILLSQMKGVDTEIPDSYAALREFTSENKQISDVIEAIVFIRNSIVSSVRL